MYLGWATDYQSRYMQEILLLQQTRYGSISLFQDGITTQTKTVLLGFLE